MTKPELIELLNSLRIPVNEGTPEDTEVEAEVRICFWDYLWEDITASGENYNTNVTYQISVIADNPRHTKLIELKHSLNEIGLFPTIQHEYDVKTRRWHSFFSLEVLENV